MGLVFMGFGPICMLYCFFYLNAYEGMYNIESELTFGSQFPSSVTLQSLRKENCGEKNVLSMRNEQYTSRRI